LKPERWGSPLVGEEYQGEEALDKRPNNNNNNNNNNKNNNKQQQQQQFVR
jgi:hypothetical protein